MRLFIFCWLLLAYFQPLAAQTNEKDKAYAQYVGNYVQSVLSEINICEKGVCPHNLRKTSLALNQYDTCSLGNCVGNKELQIWYKINGSAEKWEDAVVPVRILVVDKSKFWEGQQFIFEGTKLVYYSYENQLEVGEMLLRDSAIVAKNEILSEYGKDEKQKNLLNQYKTAESQWKNGALVQQQAQRYLDKLYAIALLYIER